MFLAKAPALFLAATIFATAGAVSAQDLLTPPASAADAFVERVALMKENGRLLRTASALSGADAVAAAETVLNNLTRLTVLFPEGSGQGTEALPAIWENWEAFSAILDKGIGHAESAVAAANAGDSAGYSTALRAVMGTCSECHDQFRS